jgi:hypothetical protein
MGRTVRFLGVAVLTFSSNFFVVTHLTNRSLPVELALAALVALALAFLMDQTRSASNPLTRFFSGALVSLTTSFVCVSNVNNRSLVLCLLGSVIVSCIFGSLFAFPRNTRSIAA